jgi:hypothetical protein
MSDVILPGGDDDGTDGGDLASRADSLEGARIAYVDWGKPNGEAFCEELQERLMDQYGVETVDYYAKPSPSSPLPDDVETAILESDPDGAILAIADCGSCNSSSVVDNITLEEAGIPTVQVITDEFVDLNRQIREGQGYDELPIVTVPHPTRFLERDEVASMADDVLDDVTGLLTGDRPLVRA